MDDPDWKIPERLQPSPDRYSFDLDRTLKAVVGVKSNVPSDAFTAQTLGTSRAGNGVLIRDDGLVLAVGYLITEAETIWLTSADGGGVPAHLVALDQPSGFALVQALGRLNLPSLELGNSQEVEPGAPAVFAAAGGRHHAIQTSVVARKPFAGYWEYLLENPILTSPAHPFWGGGALIGEDGKLVGIGSLVVQQVDGSGRQVDMNMVVPVELLVPMLDDLLMRGKSAKPPRPWLGIYCGEGNEMVVVQAVAPRGPAARTDVRPGDRIVAVGDTEISDLASLWRAVWALGNAGTLVKLTLTRGIENFEVSIPSTDRTSLLRAPKLH